MHEIESFLSWLMMLFCITWVTEFTWTFGDYFDIILQCTAFQIKYNLLGSHHRTCRTDKDFRFGRTVLSHLTHRSYIILNYC